MLRQTQAFDTQTARLCLLRTAAIPSASFTSTVLTDAQLGEPRMSACLMGSVVESRGWNGDSCCVWMCSFMFRTGTRLLPGPSLYV